MSDNNKINLSPEQINHILMFNGKAINELISFTQKFKIESNIQYFKSTDDIDISYPINLYDLLVGSNTYKNYKKKIDYDLNELKNKFIKTKIIIDKNTLIEKYTFQQQLESLSKLIGNKTICELLQLIIINDLIISTILSFDIMKNKNNTIMKYCNISNIDPLNITLNFDEQYFSFNIDNSCHIIYEIY
jgi:hypothetical protein